MAGSKSLACLLTPSPTPVVRCRLSWVACRLGQPVPLSRDSTSRRQTSMPFLSVLYVPSLGTGHGEGRVNSKPSSSAPPPRPSRRIRCPRRGQKRTVGGERGRWRLSAGAPPPPLRRGFGSLETRSGGASETPPLWRVGGGGPADSGISGCGHPPRPRASEVERPRPALWTGARLCCPGIGHQEERGTAPGPAAACAAGPGGPAPE